MKIMVQDASDLTNTKVRSIIGVGDQVFEVVPSGERGGFVAEFADNAGNNYKLFVKQMGKITKGTYEKPRYRR